MTIIAIDEAYEATRFKSIKELVDYARRANLIVDPRSHPEDEGGGKELSASIASKHLANYALYLAEYGGGEWVYKVQRV